MKREQALQHRVRTLGALNEAVSAMKSLSAHHFRLCRQALPNARTYRKEIDSALADVEISQDAQLAAPAGLLLIVSDLGLCGDYNLRLCQAAVEHRRQVSEGPVYCVGRRPRNILTRSQITPQRSVHAPASVDGLPTLLLELAQDLLDDFSRGLMGSLFVVSARFEGTGRFTPVLTHVLPISSARAKKPPRSTNYQSRPHLQAVIVREYLYTTLYELLLDSLAAEHGMRLLAAESAHEWLEDATEEVHRQLAASRREATTQEMLDIVAGAKARWRESE